MSEAAVRLWAVETKGAGPPAVLLHGFGGSAEGWETVQGSLGKAALAFDLPGHARSLSYPGFGSAAFAAKAVLKEMDQRGISAFHLAGHSMGGAAAALIACRAARRVLSLTLLAPGGFGPEINAPLLRSFGQASTEGGLRGCLEIMFAEGARVPSDLVTLLAGQRKRPGQTEALTVIAEKILNGGVQGVLDQDGLAELSMPVSILWGDKDRVLPASQIENAPPHFHKRVLTGCGHMLIDEAPSETAEAINAAMSRAEMACG